MHENLRIQTQRNEHSFGKSRNNKDYYTYNMK